ncbi:glycosyltransferase family 4 protein [Cognatitamlana onchidii]|uniref:glycosyltransferase family 4 protein n=1 Tax=Cognatitamlana onchidii TaxID=2562860 RepID=UPI0010A604F5|nr:glycosyltransferase family 4 protein [Algibacter onchidii]
MSLRNKKVPKKALIITYYWPPAGGPGVQRWLKFVKYLPELGIDPIVFIPENPNYPIVDDSLVSEVSAGVKIISHSIKEPSRLASFFSKNTSKSISKGIISNKKEQSFIEKLLLYIRGNFFVPDARVGWVKPAVGFLLEYIKKEEVETIITTGPPHSVHLIGLKIKEKAGLRWLADFRDPWTTIGYHKQLKLNANTKKKHKRLEQQVLNTADQVVVTSFVTKREFQNITKKPIEVITNGYDDEAAVDFEMDSKFTLSHIGSLLSKRNPEVLWKVLKDLTDESEAFSKDFQLNLIGETSENVLNSLKENSLSSYINNIGYVSHKESVMYQKKSQVLLLIEINSIDTAGIIPGKLFEYMVSNRPIIAIGPAGSDVAKIIKETNTGCYFNYFDYDILKSTILDYYKAYKQGSLKSSPIGLQKYHRRSLTQSLVHLI